MTVIASAQTVALSDDPVPVFKQLAQAGGFTNVYVGYASKTAKFSEPAGVPADYDPTIRPWYQQVVSTDGPVVTAPYVDAGTGKLVVTFAVPVKENGTLKAVVGGRCGHGQRGGERARDPSNSVQQRLASEQ